MAEKKWPCPYCSTVAASETSLKRHVSIKHKEFVVGESDSNASKWKYKCPQCSTVAGSLTSLKRHITQKH